MPKVRAFQARPGCGDYVVLSITLDRRTFGVFLEDALEEGVPVEVLVARHLTKCAGTYITQSV
jgi:hypothetical protein